MRSSNPAFEPGLLSRIPPPQKIVLLRASRIGDFINTIPVFRAIKRHLPESELTVISLPILADIIQRCPYIDRFLPFPGFPGLAEQFFEPRKTVHFLIEAQSQHYDLALQLQGTGVNSNPWMLMLGATYTAGFIRPEDSPGLLDAALLFPDQGYEVDRMLALPEFLGVSPAGRDPEFNLLGDDIAQAEKILFSSSPPHIVIHPFARDLTRRWPIERFFTVAKSLNDRFGGTVIGIGEQDDREALDQYNHQFPTPFLNLAGRITLPVLGALLKSCSIFITGDTGPAHIAYALHIPTVTIFGSGDPARNGPVTSGPFRILSHPVACRPCAFHECPIGAVCLHSIPVDAVISAATDIFTF
jgi:ADP-heptose:LPS heptosyltransferase